MKKLSILMVSALFFCSCSDEPTLEFRIVEEAPGEGLTRVRHEPSGRDFYAHDEPGLSGADVDTAWVMASQRGPAVRLRLTEEGRQRFAELTRENVGRRCGMFVDGKLVSAPVIRAPIEQGVAILDGEFSEEAAQRIAEGLSRGP